MGTHRATIILPCAQAAAIQVWVNCFLRMRCFESTGPFIRMVIEIIKGMKCVDATDFLCFVFLGG